MSPSRLSRSRSRVTTWQHTGTVVPSGRRGTLLATSEWQLQLRWVLATHRWVGRLGTYLYLACVFFCLFQSLSFYSTSFLDLSSSPRLPSTTARPQFFAPLPRHSLNLYLSTILFSSDLVRLLFSTHRFDRAGRALTSILRRTPSSLPEMKTSHLLISAVAAATASALLTTLSLSDGGETTVIMPAIAPPPPTETNADGTELPVASPPPIPSTTCDTEAPVLTGAPTKPVAADPTACECFHHLLTSLQYTNPDPLLPTLSPIPRVRAGA